MPPSRPGGDALVREVRDCLATTFAVAMSEEADAVREILQHQLDHTELREKWRPLRTAIEAVGIAADGFRGDLERAIGARFDAKLFPETRDFSQTMSISLDSLSLVPDDEVQEEIAIGNAARRLREATGEEAFVLNARLATLLGRDGIDEEQSPVHPRVFARALLDVLAKACTEPAPRLSAFGAHDPAMLHALPRAYKAANEMLVERGILPDMRRSYGAPQQARGARPAASAAPTGPPGLGPGVAQAQPAEGLFDRLLASATSSPAAAAQAAQAPPGMVSLHVRPELVLALRNLEARLEADPHAFDGLSGDGPAGAASSFPFSPDIVRRAHDDMAGALTPADSLVADLVAAMFGRLFDDADVSDAAKVQLARLQLPVFKAVMADRRFFTDPAHPIRGLIDVIAELGATEACEVDGMFPEEWLSQETDKLLAAEHLDSAAFEAAREILAGVATRCHELLADADAMVTSMRRDDARLASVQEASLEVAHRIAATECPQNAAAFAYRVWRPVLEHDHRTLGKDSERWNADLLTLDDLLWTFTPRATAVERERLATLLPSVRFRLWQGLIRSQHDTGVIEALLDEHDRIQQDLQASPLAAAQRELATTIALGPVAGEDFTATLHVSSGELDDEGVARGAWFEFTEDDGSTRRARLAWVSPVQGACVFKDIARNRSFAISLADLRAKRERGTAKPVDGPGVAHASIEGALADVARERGASLPG